MTLGILLLAGLGVIALRQRARADRPDSHRRCPVNVRGASGLIDGKGTQGYPWASQAWTSPEPPTSDNPAVVVFDYGEAVTVAALGHWCYRPGSRDQRAGQWLAGPSSFEEVRISLSDDDITWQEAAHLQALKPECPQLLVISAPQPARYLKLEVLKLTQGAYGLCSYEIETYLNDAPSSLPQGDTGKPEYRGFPGAAPGAEGTGAVHPGANASSFEVIVGSSPPEAAFEVRVDGRTLEWKRSAEYFTAEVSGAIVTMNPEVTGAGVKLAFSCDAPVRYPFPRLEVRARPSEPPTEWCIPEYCYSASRLEEKVEVSASIVPTCVSIISGAQVAVGLVPDTDRSWIGVEADAATAVLPLTPEGCCVMLVCSEAGWFNLFTKAVVDVFGFDQPRQFSPVSEAVVGLCRYLLQPSLWSKKYDTLRSFPDTDFFYLFYSLPYAIPALLYWEELSGDPEVGDKVDRILKFALDRRFNSGPMTGAIFSEYADRELFRDGAIPYGYPPYYTWWKAYRDEELIGLDQGCNRWVTSHTQGAVLWSMTRAWRSRQTLSDEALEGARSIADWLVRFQRDDGSWAYAYGDDGQITSPSSGSGSIWNIWSLYRFGQLTGDTRYSSAASQALSYFKKTFIANHLYRGYWEDVYGGGKTELNANQGYEASLTVMAMAEMGEEDAMLSAARDSLRFVCTRTLESRTYWTSYGGASEQRGWAPGAYIAPAFGWASQKVWRMTGEDIFRRFAGIGKTIGWWQDTSGGGLWLGEASSQIPIEDVRVHGGGRQFWVSWDSAQKASFMIPWLVDEFNRRTADRAEISTESLRGRDDRGVAVALRLFHGAVSSASGQVNWIWMKSLDAPERGEFQLALMNHAEETEVTVRPPLAGRPLSVRAFDASGAPTNVCWSATSSETQVRLLEGSTAILVYQAS